MMRRRSQLWSGCMFWCCRLGPCSEVFGRSSCISQPGCNHWQCAACWKASSSGRKTHMHTLSRHAPSHIDRDIYTVLKHLCLDKHLVFFVTPFSFENFVFYFVLLLYVAPADVIGTVQFLFYDDDFLFSSGRMALTSDVMSDPTSVRSLQFGFYSVGQTDALCRHSSAVRATCPYWVSSTSVLGLWTNSLQLVTTS